MPNMEYKLKVYTDFLNIEYSYDKPVSLYVDKIIDEADTNIKIALVVEPNTILKNYHKYIIENWTKFDFILTYDTEILKLSNAILFEFGFPWIQHLGYDYPVKKFGISTVVSNKQMAPGHIVRQELWNRQAEIKNKFFFKSYYGSPSGFENTPILGASKYPLFDYQYCIIIENTKSDYFFTEKILDCILCKTIPIYWGANKISNYFDNIIQVENVDQIIKICNSLKDTDYKNSETTIEINLEKAIPYERYNNRITKKILKLIE